MRWRPGGVAQAAAAGAVVPPAVMDDASILAAAEIIAYTSEAAALLGAAAGMQGMYGASVSTAGLTYELVDTLNAAIPGIV